MRAAFLTGELDIGLCFRASSRHISMGRTSGALEEYNSEGSHCLLVEMSFLELFTKGIDPDAA